METVRTVIGCAFIAAGIIFFIIEIIGNLRLRFILNRMHAAGIGDSFALPLFIIGCIILNGITVLSLKCIIAGVVLFFTSPVCSHLLSDLEAETNEKLDKYTEVEEKWRS